jgi:hypothetical protein
MGEGIKEEIAYGKGRVKRIEEEARRGRIIPDRSGLEGAAVIVGVAVVVAVVGGGRSSYNPQKGEAILQKTI